MVVKILPSMIELSIYLQKISQNRYRIIIFRKNIRISVR